MGIEYAIQMKSFMFDLTMFVWGEIHMVVELGILC